MRAECSGSLSLRSEESRPSKPCKSLLPPEVKTIRENHCWSVCVCCVRVLGRGRKNEIEEERKDSIQLDRRSILLPAIRILEKQSLTYCEGRSRVASTIIPGKSRTNDNNKNPLVRNSLRLLLLVRPLVYVRIASRRTRLNARITIKINIHSNKRTK